MSDFNVPGFRPKKHDEISEIDRKLAGDKMLHCHLVCRLHANQVIEAQALAALPGKILSRLYSLTLLLRTSGHFARMVRGLCPIAAEAVIVESGAGSLLFESLCCRSSEALCAMPC